MRHQGLLKSGWSNPVFLFVFVIFTLTASDSISSQGDKLTDENEQSPENLKSVGQSRTSFFGSLGDDFIYLFGQEDFYQVVGGLSLAPFIFESQFNNESPEFTEAWGGSKFAENFFEPGEWFGDAIYPLAASALILSFTKSEKQSPLWSFGSSLLRAQILNGIVTISMKAIINRKRPDGAPYGYPSGHTTTAFTTAGVVYHHYGPKIGIPAFIIATYVGFSRLQENKHYFTDIIAGSIIGTYLSYKITNIDSRNNNFALMPAIIDNSPGIRLSFDF